METSQRLLEVEAIHQLKARYCRFLDAKDWAAWRQVFTDNLRSDFTEAGGKRLDSADALIAYLRKLLGGAGNTTAHQIHAPEIKVLSDSSASGIWALHDVVRLAPGFTLVGFGHYHETYEKLDGQWRIASTRLTRLREDIETPIFKFKIPDWLKSLMSRSAERIST